MTATLSQSARPSHPDEGTNGMSEQEHKPGFLNGYRIPLLINGAILLPIAGVMITLWADVRQIKNERAERVSGERIAKIEGQVESLTREVRRNDEEGQRDRQRIWQVLDREFGARREH